MKDKQSYKQLFKILITKFVASIYNLEIVIVLYNKNMAVKFEDI